MFITVAAVGVDAILLGLIGVTLWARPRKTGRVVWSGNYLRIESMTQRSQWEFADGPGESKVATVFSIDGPHHMVMGTIAKPWFLREGTQIELLDLGGGRHQIVRK